MSSQPFDDGTFILTSTSMYPSMIGTQTTPTLTPTTLKNITDCLAGQENELYHQLEHEHQAGFVPPDIDVSASLFRSSQHAQQQQQQQHQSLQGQGQENVCNNFLHSASDNDSNQVTDEDEDDESTSFSTGGYSHCPGDSASNDSQETYSTKSSSLRSGNNRTNSSITRSSSNNNNSSSINNKSGSRAKSRTQVRRTRGARNDEKLPPEEEQRRRLRRERNKQAAARCRKRRLDHTEELTQITEGLEEEQRKMRKVLQDLERQKEELEFQMQQHLNSGNCRKSRLVSQEPVMKSTPQPPLAKIRRPSSLPLGPGFPPISSISSSGNSSSNSTSSPAVSSGITSHSGNNNVDSLIPIQTPSNGLFDGFCGLTPLLDTPSAGGFMPSVSCGGQTRGQFVSSDSMVTSPDTPMKKMVSL